MSASMRTQFVLPQRKSLTLTASAEKIKLVAGDVEAKPDVGTKNADDFKQQKVAAAIGITRTGVAMPSNDVFQKAKLRESSRYPRVLQSQKIRTVRRTGKLYFCVSPSFDLDAKFLADDIKQKGLSKTAILADARAYRGSGFEVF